MRSSCMLQSLKANVTDTAFGKEEVANLGSLENPPCLPK